jgi:hypothetical protein
MARQDPERAKGASRVGARALASDHAGRSPLKPEQLSPSESLRAFLTRLQRMSEEERVRAARFGGFDHWQRSVWAAHYPEQVPLVNGEYEWIALGLADLD